jgi:hypothetical protein
MFKNRLYGLQAIWKAIQKLILGQESDYQDTPAVEQAEREMLDNTTQDTMKPKKNRKPKPEKTASKPRKTASKAEKKPSTPAATPAKSNGTPRPGSHLEELVRMISRKNGATVQEVMESTGWTATHTVRGRISILGSKGMKIERFKHETRGTVYRVVA